MKLSKSILSQEEASAVSDLILNDGYLGMGSEVGRFEEEIANYLSIKESNVVCVNTGTSALHLAITAIVQRGDEILVPSLTFLASYQAISASGALPVSCDVYEDSLTINLEDAQNRVTSKTKAIMFVHFGSNPAYIEQVYAFAKKHHLRVIEDAAHAFGCAFKNKKIGSFGDIICFSFDGIKNITSGEGGAIVSSDEEFLSIVKDGRLLGIEKDSEKRYLGSRSWDFDVKRQGFRYHMSNIFATIGRVQLKRLDSEFAPKRIELYSKYEELLKMNANVEFPRKESLSYIIPHICTIRILNNKRDELKIELEKNNVPIGIHYKPNHLLTFYKTKYSLPITERVYNEIITLPLHPDLQMSEIEFICNIINNYLK
jgi:dTDP-4-amino-4,6-dideoxygalactose transaminase